MSQTIQDLQAAFETLGDLSALVNEMPKDLQSQTLLSVGRSIEKVRRKKAAIDKDLEVKVNALRLYWFPETVEQLKLGAYKSVRQPPQTFLIDEQQLSVASCAVCYMNYAEDGVTPVILTQRCKLNPLLSKCCTLERCHCVSPPFCLGKQRRTS